jgi:hypothetical protein
MERKGNCSVWWPPWQERASPGSMRMILDIFSSSTRFSSSICSASASPRSLGEILPLPILIPKQLGLGFNKTNQQLLL